MKNNKKVIIFDLDGTLAEFPEGSFEKSQLKKRLTINTNNYLSEKLGISLAKSKKIIKSLRLRYSEEISIGVEESFGINRQEFLNMVWNIRDGNLIKQKSWLKELLQKLSLDFSLFIVSDAPRIWVDIALSELLINVFFKNRIFSGEGNYRKSLGNALPYFLEQVGVTAKQCISVGDQEMSDIIPAKRLGMKTILVSREKKKSVADTVIKDLSEIAKFINK